MGNCRKNDSDDRQFPDWLRDGDNVWEQYTLTKTLTHCLIVCYTRVMTLRFTHVIMLPCCTQAEDEIGAACLGLAA